jgi:cardiolipin synthase
MLIIYVLNTIIAFGLIFLDDKPPTATMAWIMILYIMPVAGLLLYRILSQNIARQQIFRMTEEEKEGMGTLLGWQKQAVKEELSGDPDDLTVKWREMISMNLDYADSLLTGNESVELIYDGREMFERLCTDIENARYTI